MVYDNGHALTKVLYFGNVNMNLFRSRTLKKLNAKYFDLILMARQSQHRGNISQSTQLYARATALLNQINKRDIATYPAVKIPPSMDRPVTFKDQFADFCKALFTMPTNQAKNSVVSLERPGCDPCAIDPLDRDKLLELEICWPSEENKSTPSQEQFETRLHAQYHTENFLDDITLQQTADQTNFYSSYALKHTWSDDAIKDDEINLVKPHEKEILTSITGRNINSIRYNRGYTEHVERQATKTAEPELWWKSLWRISNNVRVPLFL